MSNYITTDSYDTPADYPRSIWDKLALGSSICFWVMFFFKLLNNRKTSLRGKFDTQTWATQSMAIFNIIEKCGGKFHISGLENINASKAPVVFISNHMSTLETMVFPGLIASRREVTFVVKESLMTHPLFGPVMRARNPIAVERKNPSVDFKKVMLEGNEKLTGGTSIVIFPQSQRMVDFDPSQFNTLGIKLAKKGNVKIIPVALKTDFWSNGKIYKDVGKMNRKLPIHIKFGKPIEINGNGKIEHQKVIDFIQENLSAWNKNIELSLN